MHPHASMSWLSACPDAKTSELVHFISCFMHLRSDLLFVLGWPSNRPTAFQRHLVPSSVLPMTIVRHFSHRLLNLSNYNTTELSSFLFRIKCIWRTVVQLYSLQFLYSRRSNSSHQSPTLYFLRIFNNVGCSRGSTHIVRDAIFNKS